MGDKLQHVALIMDGNRRWAKKNNGDELSGHKKGAENLEVVLKFFYEQDVKYITLYAFSTENWNRTDEEIKYLLRLFEGYLSEFSKKILKNDVRVSAIGDMTRFPEKIQATVKDMEEKTKHKTGRHVIFALNYGGRDEIIRAIKKMDAEKVDLSKLTEEQFEQYLDTSGLPDPELLIRTSNEHRLSNFLLWQVSYSEIVFLETLWPDISKKDLQYCVDEYYKRIRRFGS